MRESLEVRVPMLDEDLFQFGLSIPHHLKVRDQIGKRVLREVARRKLPLDVAEKPKMGFALPVDRWLDSEFRQHLGKCLLGPSSQLPKIFRPEVYRPIVELFCAVEAIPYLSRRDCYRRVMMLLAAHLALSKAS
jgi:asparagine synthase (glutamine-hydrolysing)